MQEMNREYHFELNSLNGGNNTRYGCMLGSDTVVFIKTGKDATIYGENIDQSDLYVTLAEKIFSEFGYTVFVATNPLENDVDNWLVEDVKVFENLFKPTVPGDYNMIFIGYSSGANYGAWYGCEFDKIQKMLLINPILNMNFHKLQKCCEAFNDKEIVIAVGENDSSSKYNFMIPKRDNVKYIQLQGQSHHVSDAVFIKTVMDFLKGAKV